MFWLRCFFSVSVCFASTLFLPQIAQALCEAGEAPECSEISSLEELKKSVIGVSCLRGHFEQAKTPRHVSKPLKSSGNFLLVRGSSLLLEQVEPSPRSFLFGHARVIDSKGESFSSLPSWVRGSLLSLFSAQFDHIEDDSSVTFAQEESGYVLTLVPNSTNVRERIEKFEIYGTCYPSQVKIYFQNGEQAHYRFDSIQFAPFALSEDEKEKIRQVTE